MPRIDLDKDYQQTDLYPMSRDQYARELQRRGKLEKCSRCSDWFDDPRKDIVYVDDSSIPGGQRPVCLECNEKEEKSDGNI